MAATAPGTSTAGGTTSSSSSKILPLGELKIMFFKFLEQQGYALPSEIDSVLGIGSSNSTNNNNKDNDNSDSTIKGSDHAEFQIVKRKNKRVARRLRKSSNSSQSNDWAMKIEQKKVKSMNHSDSSIKKVIPVKIVASNKKTTVSGVNSVNTFKTSNVAGSKPSLPPKVNPPFNMFET
ncbi:hypothetical protein EVAR_9970_1 [Eumeta japonica]|uniref:Uncharacterized protein n=1 Tax=Eumeta variegata TaxID=151549 RepID=A0A4C1TQY8_EUMVA|nr:hypothetical protein EVAR_9970_1 [Eumeta japonica]